jgi:hypothetical protein
MMELPKRHVDPHATSLSSRSLAHPAAARDFAGGAKFDATVDLTIHMGPSKRDCGGLACCRSLDGTSGPELFQSMVDLDATPSHALPARLIEFATERLGHK